MGAALLLAGPVGAENSTTIDPSTQPHLKTWSNIIHDATKRFVVLADFENGAGPGRRAVLDRETGLVWEQSPQTTNHTWLDARFQCANKNIGDEKGEPDRSLRGISGPPDRESLFQHSTRQLLVGDDECRVRPSSVVHGP